MELTSIKVNGKALGNEEIGDLIVNRPRNGYYVKGLDDGDEVIVSAHYNALPVSVKVKHNVANLYLDFFKLAFNATESVEALHYLEMTNYPVKLLFKVKRMGGYNRLILRGFVYEQHFDGDVYIRYIVTNDDDEERLRAEVKLEQEEEKGTGGRYDK